MMEKTEYMPCQNCPNRWVNEHNTCHSTCKKYKIWKTIHLINREERIAKKRLDGDSYSKAEIAAIRNTTYYIYNKRRR